MSSLYRRTQDVNWTYIGRPEDIQGVFWTSYIRLFYVLCPGSPELSIWVLDSSTDNLTCSVRMTSKLVMMWQEFTATSSNALKQKPKDFLRVFFIAFLESKFSFEHFQKKKKKRNYWPRKTWLLKCIKVPVSENLFPVEFVSYLDNRESFLIWLQSVALFFDLNEQSGLAKLKGRIVIEYWNAISWLSFFNQQSKSLNIFF